MAKDFVKTQHRWHVQVEYLVKNLAQTKGTNKTKFINETMYGLVYNEIKEDGGLPYYIHKYEKETGRDFLPIEELFPELSGKEKTDAEMLEVEKLVTG
jgi:hypothetical protein